MESIKQHSRSREQNAKPHASRLCVEMCLGGACSTALNLGEQLTCLGGRHVQQLRLQHHTLLEQLGVGLDGDSIHRLLQAT